VSKPYDATAKDLLELDPAAWTRFVGADAPVGVELIDSELSTITAAADKVVRVLGAEPWVLDIEFQSWRDPNAPRQLLKYNALLHEKHKCPVASVLVVLAEEMCLPSYTGALAFQPPFGPGWEFRYTVVRVWEASADELLRGPLALAPLAPVSKVELSAVPDVLLRLNERAAQSADPTTTSRLFAAAGILLRLRYGMSTAKDLLDRIPGLRELDLFQAYATEGRAEGRAEGRREEAAEFLMRQGRKKFGPPTEAHEAALAAVTELSRLEALSEKLLDVNTWDELLAGA
jgi:predicted transposase YdaD